MEQNATVHPITRFEDTPEFKAYQERYAALLGEENPYFIVHDSALTDRSLMDGQWVLNFGSYKYAGMSGRPEVSEAAIEAIRSYGTSASGSRLLAGEKTLTQTLEKELAAWKHAEDALVLVSGHATNVTFVGNFVGPNDLVVYDRYIHNSVAEGCRLSHATARPFPHNDPEALDRILASRRDKFEKVLICIEGVYSMDGDIAPVPDFIRVKEKYGCFLMVDEAHSTCVIGETGGGVDEYFGLAGDEIDIKMGTLSKGLGACGGYLCGKRSLIEYQRYMLPGFVFSVGMSPPLAAAALASLRLIQRDPSIMAQLRENVACFMEEARRHGLNMGLAGKTAILPVLVGPDDEAAALSNALRKKGVFVPPAVYPAVPRGEARLRFCVTAAYKPEQIREALDKLAECAEELGIALPKA